MYNVGSIFRTADGAGVERLALSGITARPPKSGITKTALGADESVPWISVADPDSYTRDLRTSGYEVAAIETSVGSVDLYDWRPCFPVLLIFGHEVEGIQPALLEQCDTAVRIPMLGQKHSLNVATAAGIVLYELLRKFREAALATPRDL
jgi:tRNA G18 (ribose-2'-O)-methylase SpoU